MGKRLDDVKKVLEKEKVYSLKDAIVAIKSNATKKFDETVDIAVNLSIDTKKTDQNVRGSVALPHGTGKKCVIAVFAKDKKAEEAKKAGADIVGAEDLVENVQKGEINFDVCVATPDMMSVIGRIARVLGPKGLMPNPKLGTVTDDVADIIKSLKAGRVNYKNDKGGVVHAIVGKASFDAEKLEENIKAFLDQLARSRPETAKGSFLKSMYLSSTQGGSVMFNLN